MLAVFLCKSEKFRGCPRCFHNFQSSLCGGSGVFAGLCFDDLTVEDSDCVPDAFSSRLQAAWRKEYFARSLVKCLHSVRALPFCLRSEHNLNLSENSEIGIPAVKSSVT